MGDCMRRLRSKEELDLLMENENLSEDEYDELFAEYQLVTDWPKILQYPAWVFANVVGGWLMRHPKAGEALRKWDERQNEKMYARNRKLWREEFDEHGNRRKKEGEK
jgi:hypothetical protein